MLQNANNYITGSAKALENHYKLIENNIYKMKKRGYACINSVSVHVRVH